MLQYVTTIMNSRGRFMKKKTPTIHLRIAQRAVGHCSRTLLECNVIWCVSGIRDDGPNPRHGMKKGEQGENRTTSDPVTITAKPAWRPDEMSETRDSHHAVSGDSEVDVAARVSREEDH